MSRKVERTVREIVERTIREIVERTIREIVKKAVKVEKRNHVIIVDASNLCSVVSQAILFCILCVISICLFLGNK